MNEIRLVIFGLSKEKRDVQYVMSFLIYIVLIAG
jgi:hypothetical protein